MTIKNMKIKTRESLGNTYYMVVGDTQRFGEQEILFEGINLYECECFLSKENALTVDAKAALLEAWNKEMIKDNGMPLRNEEGRYEYTVEYLNEYGFEESNFIYSNIDYNSYRKIFKLYGVDNLLRIEKSFDPYDMDEEFSLTIFLKEYGKIKYL